MQNGFIYRFFDSSLTFFYRFNLVNLFKFVAKKLTKDKRSKKDIVKNSNIAIDIFIFLKWLILLFALLTNNASIFFVSLVIYLYFYNLLTYFYYHLWNIKKKTSFEREKRRFITLILSSAFNVFCFAYFYTVAFKNNFTWQILNTIWNGLLISTETSLLADTGLILPSNSFGLTIVVLQKLTTFLFLTVLLSVSLPTNKQKG